MVNKYLFCTILSLFVFCFISPHVFAVAPVINSLAPVFGYNDTTTLIAINGKNYDSTCKVYIEAGGPYIVGSVNTQWESKDIYIKDNYAYIAESHSFQIVDINNPNNPIIVGSVNTTVGEGGVYVSGNYAYVGGSVLQIIDISNPTNPKVVSYIDVPDIVLDVYVSGNYVYVAHGVSGITIIDITDPIKPRRVGGLDTDDANGIAVLGNYAYLTDDHELLIIDVSDPYSPNLVNSINTSYADGVFISGNYAYVTNGSTVNPGLFIIDISDPLNASITGSVHTLGSTSGVYVSGSYAYVADSDHPYGDQGRGLIVIDISNPIYPFIAGSVDTPGNAKGVYLKGNYAYVADGVAGVQVIDITNPLSPNKIRDLDLPKNPYDVYVSGNYAFVSMNLGLQIIDLSDPSDLKAIGYVNIPSEGCGVRVLGNYAYIADGNAGLQVIDISNINNPFIVGSIDTPGAAVGVYVLGNLAYVADYGSGLQIIDITNPESPKILGTVDTPGLAQSVYVSGNYAYVADRGSGLKVIDVTNSSNPQIVGSVSMPGSIYDVCVSGNYAYAAVGESGLRVVNISNPNNPIIVGSVDTPGYARGIKVSGNYVYIADDSFSVQVIDITNSVNPGIVSNAYLFAEIDDLCISGDYLYTISTLSKQFQLIHKPSIINPATLFSFNNTTITAQVPLGLMPGVYNIKIINSLKEKDMLYDGFRVLFPGENLLPGVTLTSNIAFGEAPLLVNFTANAYDIDGNIVSYGWDFDGDNNYDTTTTSNIIAYTYNTAGVFNAKVRVIDNNGAQAGNNINISVTENEPPIIDLIANPTSGGAPFIVNFNVNAHDVDGTIVNYEWDFNGDNNYDTTTASNTMAYTYSIVGAFNAKVRVTDNDGGQTEDNINISVTENMLPTIDLVASPMSGTAPLKINFNANAQDMDGSIVCYEWDFNGDGSYYTTIGNTFHIYNTAGIYNLKVRVTDNSGAIAIDSTEITIGAPPTVILNVNPLSGIAPLLTTFTADAYDADGTIASYEWDFNGDGSYATTAGSTVNYTYNTSGTYNPKVRVTDDDGATAEASIEILVLGPEINSVAPDFGYNTTVTPITVSGKYLDSSCGLYIEAGGPYIVGSLNLSEDALDVYISGNYAYVADGDGGLKILNISDPSNPIVVGCVPTVNYTNSVHGAGNYIYVTDITYGLRIIDVTDPIHPSVIANLSTPAFADDVYISGNYAYVACGFGGLQIINVSNPSNPYIAGSVNTLNFANGVYVSGSYAYVADSDSFNGPQGRGLVIIDISSPGAPRIIGSVNTPGDPNEVYVSGNYAYVADWHLGLQIIDVSIPSNPRIVSSIDTPGNAASVYVSGHYTYVADYTSGLQIIDTNNPLKPKLISNIETNKANGVYVSGNYAYVADYDSGGIKIIDIGNLNPPNIILGSVYTTKYASGIYVSGNYAYVADDWKGLMVVDISNSSNPLIVGSVDTPGSVVNVYISGKYAFVADGSSGLQVVDISNPLHPFIAGSVDTPGYAMDVFVSGNYVFMADGSSGLQVINVSDPTKPSIVGSVNTPGSAYEVYLSGSYAYVADGSSGLQVIDITDPTAPSIIGSVDTPGNAVGVYISGNYAFISDGSSGLQVADISNPTDPSIASSVDTLGYACNINISGNFAYVSDLDSGLQIIDVSNPTKPIIVKNLDIYYSNASYVCVSGDYIYLLAEFPNLNGAFLKKLNIICKNSLITNLGKINFIDSTTFTAEVPAMLIDGNYNIKLVSPSEKDILHNSFLALLPGQNILPKVNLTADFETGRVPFLVNFTADAYDLNGTIIGFDWDCDGDGKFDTSTVNNTISHYYSKSGQYKAVVKVTDNDGGTVEDTTLIIVNPNYPPTVSLSISVGTIHVKTDVTFTSIASDSDGTIIKYEWDFDGDGNFDTSTVNNTIVYNYSMAGQYNAVVKVTDNDGATAKATKLITVNPNHPPIVSLSRMPDTIYIKTNVIFTAIASDSDGIIKTYEWDLDGNNIFETRIDTSTISNTYYTPGTYTIKVRVTDNSGDTAVASENITVNKTVTQPLGNIDIMSVGSDTRIDGHDLYVFSKAFGSVPQDNRWNCDADLNDDLVVDGNDLVILANNFGKTTFK